MTWSPQQDAALKAVDAWLKSPSEEPYYLGGFAGTGKTTLAKHLAEGVKGDVLFAAFTGKAALVMRAKGCVGASTIHSLIYRPKPKRDGSVTFELNEDSPVAEAALVVVDECSMVGPELGRDLMSFGTKVLVLGDPAQLPPVDGAGYFTGGEPDFMLTEVHRQAADNPIIAMSMRVREGGRLDIGSYGESRVIPRRALGRKVVMGADQILVGRNATRRGVNAKVRGLLERDPAGPQSGDRLVCLRNDKEKKLLNGGLWDIADVVSNDGASVEMDVTPDDDPRGAPVRVGVLSEFFHGQEDALTPKQRRGYQEFTYGYALTVHKSQGSQWNRVVLFDEGSAFREHQARWLYTGVTRAAEQVVVVQS